ncbi:DUF916 domain-containing protein [Jiangella mangrovi]|uniref:DUF916 domain-containing protein n=1 Tax=Jiangella mangrovi TaxID=1524084 RepID=A0A7W9GPL4_9ACTN|nr:DUF916 domain-containing protein [Jiangella mangrovi]MBB5787695.1 hypothetical protein [Jiangella mangrovi]
MTVLTAAATAAAAALVLAGAAAATADTTVTWGVKPADNGHGSGRPNYAYAVEPGGSLSDALVVTNHDEGELALRVYAADGFTTSSGQLDLRPAGEEPVGVGAWVAVDAGELLLLGPGETAEVPFTLTVPDDATPGDHTGGIVASLLGETNADGITVERRLGSRIHVRVGGELTPSLAVQDLRVDYDGSADPFATGTATVSYTVANTGNARMTAGQTVRVAGPFGLLGTGAEAPDLPELLPGATHEVSVVVDGMRPLVRATATVTLTPRVAGDDATELPPVERSSGGWAVPWSVLVVLALAVALLVRRRFRRPRAVVAVAPA